MKIIQLTDLHLVPEGQKIHEIDPGYRLEQALANIKLRHSDLDLLVITGDLCNEGDVQSYQLLKALLEKYELHHFCQPQILYLICHILIMILFLVLHLKLEKFLSVYFFY